MSSPVRITLRNMHFHVRVGVLPHEAELSQPLEIDLTVWAAAPEHGSVSVDYRALHALTAEVLAQQPLRYLETIAQDLVARSLAHDTVIGARAAVRKPHVALGGPLDHAEIVIEGGVTHV
ncbi:MAG TPA: dihydroneopterin aldolase [Gemmatimonadaceae bacterium]|nr:dihydroneopterin aldolase [Gemmatimonadaceae bacterium]